jgi:2-C-methyl-D-erythritol 4-phosphate cytidylyltransferase
MICALIVAGGSGLRMKAPLKKQYLRLNDLPIVSHTLIAFDRYPAVEKIILVTPENDREWCQSEIIIPLSLDHDIHVVAGGRRRQASVRNGLEAVGAADAIVMIHDGVRPFVSPSLMDACLAGVQATGACIPAIPATDTLKQVDENGLITGTLDRRRIRLAQTPQTFAVDLIRRAHQLAGRHGFVATDDASVAEFAGERVAVVPGDPDNIKITTPQDLALACAILARRSGEQGSSSSLHG